MQPSHFIWIGSVFLRHCLGRMCGPLLQSCSMLKTSATEKLHPSMHPSLSLSIYLYIYIYLIIIYPIYLINLSIHPSIYHFVLTPLKTEAANILLFNSTKTWTIFQRQSAEPIFCLADQQFCGKLGGLQHTTKKTQSGRIFGLLLAVGDQDDHCNMKTPWVKGQTYGTFPAPALVVLALCLKQSTCQKVCG